MPYLIVRQDISRIRVDAIVSPTPQSMLPGDGGASGAIFTAAGPELAKACAMLGPCPVGQAALTPGYQLPATHIIHAPSPRWQGGTQGEETLLRSAWQAALALAERHQFNTVAFPLLGAGAHGFPHGVALQVAASEINRFLLRLDRDATIYLAVFSRHAYNASQKLAQDVRAYVDDHYVDAYLDQFRGRRRPREHEETISIEYSQDAAPHAPPDGDMALFEERTERFPPPKARPSISLPSLGRRPEKQSMHSSLKPIPGFAARMIALIDSRGMSDPEVYKRANLTKQAFYKIKNELSQPQKKTALALCIGLKLSLPEAENLMALAGYAFSPASRPDLIVRYFIEHRLYNVMEINSMLFAEGFEKHLLGSV